MADLDSWFFKPSYNNSTTCIKSNNIELIEQALTSILKKEGCRLIPKPPLSQTNKPLTKELLHNPQKIDPYLWVIGLTVGNLGWSIIKTSIPKLLCRRAREANLPRLSELAIQTGCDVFHSSVQDRYFGVILEANASGQILASGHLDCYGIENMKFFDEPVTRVTEELSFSLLNVPEEFHQIGQVKEHLSQKEKQRREDELEALVDKHPEKITQALTEWRELNMSTFERGDEDLGELLCNSNSRSYYTNYWSGNKLWHEKRIIYKAYAELEQLEKEGVKLLFFQVGGFDLSADTEEIWSPIINFDRNKYYADMVKANLGYKKYQ